MVGSRSYLLSSSLLGIVMAGAMPAYAQGDAQPVAPAAETVAPPADAADVSVQEIVVTGSRIRRKDFVAESPIVTVGETLMGQKGPATIDNTLTTLPQFSASSGSATQSGANQQARGARANLNLRGLGIARTLVLLDGRRLQPSDPLGNAIDLNTIPSNIIGNIEVISGGASAVYGSDAVAGVVNILTKKNFKGLELDAQYGQSWRDDGRSVDVSALMGSDLADSRGHAMLSLSFFDRGAAYKAKRGYFDGTGDTNAPAQGRYTPSGNNLPSQAALNALFASYGSAAPTPSQALSINLDNTLFSTGPARNLRLTAADGFGLARDGSGLVTAFTPYEAGTLLNPLRRYNAYATFDYELSDAITAYGIVNYTTYHATNQQRGTLNGTSPVATIPVTNPFLPADLRTILASRPNPTASFNYSFFGDRVGPQVFDYDYDVGQITAGLKGNLGLGDWTWDVSGSYGHTAYDLTASGYVNITALQTLLNAPDGGTSICSGGFQPFDFAPVSDACAKYLTRTLKERTTLDQYVAEANFEGGLFRLPAGEARLAAGLTYRRNRYSFLGDDQQIFSQVYFSRPVQNSSGTQEVGEIYGELALPVLRDSAIGKSFDVNLAYRYSNYSGIGGVHAYKASGDWQIFEGLRLRGGYQRAVRAPSVGELFGGGRSVSSSIGTTASGQGDPCDITSSYRNGAKAAQVRALCVAQGVPAGTVDSYRFTGSTVTTSQLGNADLSEEKADTYTIGAVLRSPFSSPLLSGLTLSVDYFDIRVKGAIGNITTAVSLQRCFNGDGSNPAYSQTNYFCSLLTRDANGNLNFPQEPALNLAGYRTSGIDFLVDWQFDLDALGLNNGGRVGLNSAISYVPTYKIQSLAGNPYLNYAGTVGNTQIDQFTSTHPKWKAQTTLTYAGGPVALAFTWNYTGKVDNATNVVTSSANVRGVDSASYFDLSAKYKINDRYELRAGLQNMFDADPPVGPTPGAADLVAYDVLGRRFSVGVNARF